MNYLYFIPVVLLLFAFLAWFAYDTIRRSQPKKAIIHWYERVNGHYAYKGKFTAKTKKDVKLGRYLANKGMRFFMDEPSSDDYIPFKNTKILNVAKFGEEDWRVIKLLSGNGFYQERDEVVYEDVEELDESSGEKKVYSVPKRDKDGKLVTATKKYYFQEPMAITQSDKEVARFGREYHRRMDELKRSTDGWWQKNGSLVLNTTAVILFFLFIIIFVRMDSKADLEMNAYWADKFGENAQEAIAAIEQPNFIENLVSKFQGEEANANAPIS